MFMYCKTCRQPLPHDARRRPNCGAPVENTVLQSGARDFTADYDPRDIQENRGWGISFLPRLFGTHPHFRCAQLVFCAFPLQTRGWCCFFSTRCYSVLTRIITEHLKRLTLGFIPIVPGMISAALQFIGIIFFVLDHPRHRKRRFRQSKGAAVHRPYSPFEITVHSKIALRNFLSQGIFIREFRKTVAHKVDICYTA